MATNMNIRPYYDDFSEDSNYYRILFRPSFSVQARELTQLQTILNDQVSKVGNSLLDDGDVLSGGEMSYNSAESEVTVKDGIYYLNGIAVNVVTQTIVGVDPNHLVGFLVVEEFINAGSDDTLYDNAAGSPNYRGPGADRFKISLELVSREEVIEDEIFIEIFRLINGKLYQSQTTVSSIVTEDNYAQKVKKSDGDYVTDSFDIDIISSASDSTKYTVSIGDGSAIIDGKDISITGTESIDIDKSLETHDGTQFGDSNLVDVDPITALIETGQYSYVYKMYVYGIEMDTKYDFVTSGNVKVGEGTTTHIAPHNSEMVKLFFKDVIITDFSKSFSDIKNLHVVITPDNGDDNINVFIGLYSGDHTGAEDESNKNFVLQGSDSRLFRLSDQAVRNMSEMVFDGVRVVQTDNISSTADYVTVSNVNGNVVDKDSICLLAYDSDGNFQLLTSTEMIISTLPSKIVFQHRDSSFVFLALPVATWTVFYSIQKSVFETASKSLTKGINQFFTDVSNIDEAVAAHVGELSNNDVILDDFKVYEKIGTYQTQTVNATYDFDGDVTWKDVTSKWILTTTESNSSYGDAYLKIRPTSLPPGGAVVVVYSYWHSDGSGIYNGKSYDLAAEGYDHTLVSSYVDSDGKSYSLLDAIDLRRNSDIYYNCSFSAIGKVVPKRKDSLVLKSDKTLSVVRGAGYTRVASDNYVENGIKLYDLNIEPYEGISYTRTHGVRNTNFIHNLGDRISKLEDQILFSPLEARALASDVGDKTIEGVLVDGFRGTSKADSNTFSIDYINNELRPDYTTVSATLNHSDRVITLPLDSTVPKISDIANLQSDSSILINNITYSKDIGYVSIKPLTWKDTVSPLSIMSDPDNNFNGINHTSVWNDWENFWYGTVNEGIYSSTIDVDNKGRQLLGNNYKAKVGGFVEIDILASDDSLSEAWDLYIDPPDSNKVPIQSSNTGKDIIYHLDNSLLSGKRVIEVSNSKFSATNYLYARGFGHIGQENPLTGLVQEFDVVTDTFYTEVDLYFDTVASDGKPIFIQLQDMSTGEAVPYSTVMKTVSNISDVGKQTFTFSEKILLKSGKYALVVSTTSTVAKLVTGKYTGISIGPLNGNRFSSLKFNLYRANFSTEADISLSTDTISYPIEKIFVNKGYQNQLKVYQSNHGFSGGDVVNLSGFSGRLVQEIVLGSNGISNMNNVNADNAPYIGYTVFQQLVDTPSEQITDVPNVSAFNSSLETADYAYNYGTIMDWNTSNNTVTIELISGTFNKFATSIGGSALMLTIVTGDGGGVHLDIGSISPTTADYEAGTVEGVQTSIGGISSFMLNDEVFKVVSTERDSFVVEMDSTKSFTPTVTGFYADDTSVVLNGKYRSDLVYLNSAKYAPTDTTEKWELKNLSGVTQAQLTPNSNTYFPTSKNIEGPNVLWTITSGNSRVSPVLYRDASDLLMISNNLDNGTFNFTGLNMDWGTIEVTKVGITNGVLGEEAGTTSELMWLSTIAGIEIGDYLLLEAGDTDALVVVTDTHSEVISAGNTNHNSSGHKVSGVTSMAFNTTNKLYKLIGYIPETHPTDGTALSKYISNKVTFDNSINGVKVEFDGICPSGNWFEVYADVGNNEFIELPRSYPKTGVSSSYTDYCYQANVEYTNELKVKLVMQGTNTIDVPKVKNLIILGLSDDSVIVPTVYTVEPSINYTGSQEDPNPLSVSPAELTGPFVATAGNNYVDIDFNLLTFSNITAGGSIVNLSVVSTNPSVTGYIGASLIEDNAKIRITDQYNGGFNGNVVIMATDNGGLTVNFTINNINIASVSGSAFSAAGDITADAIYMYNGYDPRTYDMVALGWFGGGTPDYTFSFGTGDNTGVYNRLSASISGNVLTIDGSVVGPNTDTLFIEGVDSTSATATLTLAVDITNYS